MRIACSVWEAGMTLSPPSPRPSAACASCRSRRGTDSPRLPIQPFLDVCRTPLLQFPQQLHRRFPCEHQRPVLRLQETLLHCMVEHPEQRSVKTEDIKDAAGLRVQPKLRPSKHLAKFLQRSESARHGDERIGKISHQRLAFMHGVDDMKFGQSLVPDFPCHEVLRYDSNRLASSR